MLPVREVEKLAIKSKVIYFLMKKYSNKCLMMDHHYQFKVVVTAGASMQNYKKFCCV